MAARFPQSTTAVAYKIKAAYASKVLALYWAADADKVHKLLPGEESTAILTRTTSGAGFNADGRITGNNNTYYFSDHTGTSTGFGGLTEDSDFVFGYGIYGDAFDYPAGPGWPKTCIIGGKAPPDTFVEGFYCYLTGTRTSTGFCDGRGEVYNIGTYTDDVPSLVTAAMRFKEADATAKFRVWANGSEDTGKRSSGTSPARTDPIGSSTRPIYFGGSATESATGLTEWEFCFIGTGDLTDAELDAITADPSILIEAVSGSETITLTPDPASVQVGSTRTFTATRSAPAGAGGVTYNVSSNNPAVATVPTPQALTEADSDLTFDATGVSVGTANITITNAADSNETDTVALTVTAVTTKKAKFLVHPDFASAAGITIEVNEAPTGGALTGAKLGFATGIAAESTLEGGQAVIKVNAADVGASALAAGTSVRAIFKGLAASGSALGSGAEAGSVVVATGTIIEE